MHTQPKHIPQLLFLGLVFSKKSTVMLSCQKANSNSHFGLNLEARLLIFRSSTFCGAVLLLYGHKFTCPKDMFIGLHSQREHFLHLEHSSQCSEQYQQLSQLLVWWGPPSPISEQSASSASPSRAVRIKVVPHHAEFSNIGQVQFTSSYTNPFLFGNF